MTNNENYFKSKNSKNLQYQYFFSPYHTSKLNRFQNRNCCARSRKAWKSKPIDLYMSVWIIYHIINVKQGQPKRSNCFRPEIIWIIAAQRMKLIWSYLKPARETCMIIYTLWLVEPSNFSSSLGMSTIGIWKPDLVILFHSFSTRKNIHWNLLSISKAVTINTVK